MKPRNMSQSHQFNRSSKRSDTLISARQKLWLGAIPVAAALLSRAASAQTLLFQVTPSDYDATTGALNSDVGPSGTITSTGSVSIQTNATPNGSSALSFNGTGGFGLASTIASTTNAVTIFAVVLPIYDSNSNPSTIVAGSPGSLQYRIDGGGDNLGEPAFLNRDNFQFANSSAPLDTSNFSVIDASLNPNTGAPNGVIFNTNGVNVGDNGAYGFDVGGINSLGAASNGDGTYNEFFNGAIAEVQIYDGVLTTSQRQTIENNLASSFGIVFANPNFNWNTTTGLFTTGSSWDQGTAPNTATQFATISNGGTAQIVTGNSISLGSLTVGSNTSTGTGTVTHEGGDVVVSGTLGIGTAGGTGTYNISDGTITTHNLYIGNAGTGTLLQSGGTITVNSDFQVGQNAGVGTFNMTAGTTNYTGGNYLRILGSPTPSSINLSGTATLNDTGGPVFPGVDNNGAALVSVTDNATLNSSNGFDLGYTGCTGVLNISGNATVTSGGDMLIGWNGTGIVNMTGGSLTENGTMHIGYSGPATFNQSGGTITTTAGGFDVLMSEFSSASETFNMTGGVFDDSSGATAVGYRALATINLGGGPGTAQYLTSQMQLGIVAGQGSGVLNLNPGGILTTNTLQPAGGGGTVNFNGGTLQALSNTGGLLTGFTTGQVTANAAGAIIDTQMFTATILAPIGGPGGLTKVGGGTLVMGGSSTYAGSTKINAGKLQLLTPSLNLSFETPANAGGANYAPAGASWTFSTQVGTNGAGITDGSAFNFSAAPPDGSQAAFVQGGGYIEQNFYFPAAGFYTISFYTEQRFGSNDSTQSLDVTLDDPRSGGQDLSSGGFTPTGDWTQITYTFNVSQGTHYMDFSGTNPNGGDNTAFIDDISFSPGVTSTLSRVSTAIPSTSPIVLATGGTFDVNNAIATVGSLNGPSGSFVTLGSGVLTIGADNSSTTFAGNISDGGGNGSLVKIGSGIQTLSGSNTYLGSTNVSGGTLIFSGASAFPAGTSASVGLAATLVLPSETALESATSINLNGNLIVHNGSIGAISTLLKTGYNGGAWNGSGILASTAAAADLTHLTAIGSVTGVTGTFEGQPVTASDVLLKYTYYGDANLDGAVNSVDYVEIDNGYLSQTGANKLTGWQNGDFNYDGVINGSDYTLIDNAFNMQGASFSAAIATPTAQIGGSIATAVPEPASIGLIGIGAAGLLGRRARSRRHR